MKMFYLTIIDTEAIFTENMECVRAVMHNNVVAFWPKVTLEVVDVKNL